MDAGTRAADQRLPTRRSGGVSADECAALARPGTSSAVSCAPCAQPDAGLTPSCRRVGDRTSLGDLLCHSFARRAQPASQVVDGTANFAAEADGDVVGHVHDAKIAARNHHIPVAWPRPMATRRWRSGSIPVRCAQSHHRVRTQMMKMTHSSIALACRISHRFS